MEHLSHIISNAIREGKWKRIKLVREGPMLSHLFFANDLVPFREASAEQMHVMKECLNILCSCSGQKVSLLKSQLFVSNNGSVSVAWNLEQLAKVPLTKDLKRYLGVTSIQGRVTKNTFSYILERINDRLEGWKTKQLSFAGKQVIATSVLNTIPYYAMHLWDSLLEFATV